MLTTYETGVAPMSFQAYLDSIEDKTGLTPRQFIALAQERGFDDPATKAGEILAWLKDGYSLGRGHGMAPSPGRHALQAGGRGGGRTPVVGRGRRAVRLISPSRFDRHVPGCGKLTGTVINVASSLV
ncbi:DUF4287 domain-containing protein [Streptomyces aculeolatus]